MTEGTTAMSPQEMAEACARRMWDDDSASRDLGMRIDHIAPGEATLSMTVTDLMTNGHGSAHGGFIFVLADSAFAFACNTYDRLAVGQHCSITYIAPGAGGDRLVATAREVSRRGRSGIYDVSVAREDGTPIAEFRGHSRTVDRTLLSDADGAPV